MNNEDSSRIFWHMKYSAGDVFRKASPSSLAQYEEAMFRQLVSYVTQKGMGPFSEQELRQKASSSAQWWWTHVFAPDGVPARTDGQKEKGHDALVRLLERDAVIFDTETTGLKADRDRVIELSIIDMSGEVLFSSLFNPHVPLGTRITEITGLDDIALMDAPDFRDRADEIGRIMNGRTVVGWNVPFDARFMQCELSRVGKGFSPAESIDAMELCSYALGRGVKSLKLQKAKAGLGLGDSQEHRSLADCMDTLAVMRAVVEGRPFREEENA